MDDSRDPQMLGQPMELVLGKKFKLEVWEAIVQQMALNEVAKFKVDKKVGSGLKKIFSVLHKCLYTLF